MIGFSKLGLAGSFAQVARYMRRIETEVLPATQIAAANQTNNIIRSRVINDAVPATNSPKRKTVSSQIRIPKSFRAKKGKPFAGGIYNLTVRASTGTKGRQFVLSSKAVREDLPSWESFDATFTSGRTGVFTRAPKGAKGFKRPRRPKGAGPGEYKYRTWLPIREVMVDATPIAGTIVRRQLKLSPRIFKKQFKREFERRLARL